MSISKHMRIYTLITYVWFFQCDSMRMHRENVSASMCERYIYVYIQLRLLRLRAAACHGGLPNASMLHFGRSMPAAVAGSVHHQGVRLHRGGRVVQRVRVLRRFALQLTLVGQRAGAAVAEKAVHSKKNKPNALDRRSTTRV